MWTSALLTATCFALAAGVCPRYETGYYEELGCEPGELGSDGCHRSYNCSMVAKLHETKCVYKGHVYSEGEFMQPNSGEDCVANCQCIKPDPNAKPAFRCIRAECGELFTEFPHGCYPTYEHDYCCSTGIECNSTDNAEPEADNTTCIYEGHEYRVGMRFYPREEPCLDCICQAGFNGSLVEPFCETSKCHLELLHSSEINEGCIPIYYGNNRCCPFHMRCPDKPYTLISNATGNNDSDLQCQFGNVTMQVGDSLGGDPNVECTCRVPPHPICISQTLPL